MGNGNQENMKKIDYDRATLPTSLTKHFKKSNWIHNYQTRMATQGKLHK